MTQALQRSGLRADEVDFIAGASNGLPRLARAEIDAIQSLFGAAAAPLVGNVKSALGETLGAATALSTVFAVDTIADASVAPVWGLAAGLLPARYVAGQAAAAPVSVALVNGIELGGTITSLALRRYGAPAAVAAGEVRP
jgi:3-oxoacyl-(acyl-carrier-protein) synthase